MAVRLLCDAIPFCYGPAAVLETFLASLFAAAPGDFEVDVLATGSARELLDRAQLPIRFLRVDSEDASALQGVPFDSYDAFLNVCNPVSFEYALSRGTRTAYLDFLLWMHAGPAAPHFDAHLYIAENYPGTPQWVAERGAEIRNLQLVPPIVRPVVRRAPTDGFLLVGLGGLYSRLTQPGVNTNYAPFVVERIIESLPLDRFSRVLIAGPSGIAPLVARIVGGRENVEYASLAHDAFLDELAHAELFLSHPGLYAAFEAMLGGVPTAFLPPSNYTQILQLRHYRAHGLADLSFSWADAGLEDVPEGLPEVEGVRAVLSVLRNAERSEETSAAFSRFLADVFHQPSASLPRVGARQQMLAAQFGLAGPRVAAERFIDWVGNGRTLSRSQ